MRRKRRQRTCSTLLEGLPNELLAQIFSYLNGVDAIYAFSCLNNRFKCLLIETCELFDFKSISKLKFDLVLQHQNTKRWKSLRISDDEHTPGHTEYVCQVYSLSNDFPQLQSLVLLHLHSQKMCTVLSQLSSLKTLVSLTIKSLCREIMPPLDLPNLKKLVFGACSHIDWIKNFSQLESVEYTIENCHWFIINDLPWPSTLTHLRIIFHYEECWSIIQRSLFHLSLLNTLEIYQIQRATMPPNGQIWETLIRSSLPLLKIFKFYFNFKYSLQSPYQMDEAVASFSTPFYILENKWFIRCDISDRGCALLYSLPFPFETYTALQGNNIKTISTFLDDYNNDFYTNIFSNVTTLEVLYKSSEPDENFHSNGLINLTIHNDFDSIKWMHVLNKLQHLEMHFLTAMPPNNFLHILKNAPHLRSLVTEKRILQIATEHWNNISICDHLSCKIISLKLCGRHARTQYINKHATQQIIRIFSSKCQHLSLCIQSSDNTIGFILENMPQLQSLHVNIYGKIKSLIDMTWLQKEQTIFNSSNCIILSNGDDHYFWLGKHQSYKNLKCVK
ncbi:unnamed protein product [Rotaria socialis]|uniref:F-box domain-containing protein n=2 Tax=Rotaria socialis TaxID=392032 RepID=A0A820QZ15_9BILA|nr:unnamed protein product [Rotaria socialis]CAF4429188.1 unnamed protein product [Rotaria socialis]